MIHLPTAAGGRVEHVVRRGAIVTAGTLLTRVHPDEGPAEELVSPVDGEVMVLRLANQHAPQFTTVVGVRRLILASCEGRVRWVATLGPVGLTTMVALIDRGDAVRPHRAGSSGFVGERFVRPGQRVKVGEPLLEIRGEELV